MNSQELAEKEDNKIYVPKSSIHRCTEMAFKEETRSSLNLISFISACKGSDLEPVTSVLTMHGVLTCKIRDDTTDVLACSNV